MSTLGQRLATPAAVAPVDHCAGLRSQRRTHMENARWWKRRYQAWGGDLALRWFLTEARSHRHVNRIIWTMGTN